MRWTSWSVESTPRTARRFWAHTGSGWRPLSLEVGLVLAVVGFHQLGLHSEQQFRCRSRATHCNLFHWAGDQAAFGCQRQH